MEILINDSLGLILSFSVDTRTPYLACHSILTLSLVCKKWREVIRSSEYFWFTVYNAFNLIKPENPSKNFFKPFTIIKSHANWGIHYIFPYMCDGVYPTTITNSLTGKKFEFHCRIICSWIHIFLLADEKIMLFDAESEKVQEFETSYEFKSLEVINIADTKLGIVCLASLKEIKEIRVLLLKFKGGVLEEKIIAKIKIPPIEEVNSITIMYTGLNTNDSVVEVTFIDKEFFQERVPEFIPFKGFKPPPFMLDSYVSDTGCSHLQLLIKNYVQEVYWEGRPVIKEVSKISIKDGMFIFSPTKIFDAYSGAVLLDVSKKDEKMWIVHMARYNSGWLVYVFSPFSTVHNEMSYERFNSSV